MAACTAREMGGNCVVGVALGPDAPVTVVAVTDMSPGAAIAVAVPTLVLTVVGAVAAAAVLLVSMVLGPVVVVPPALIAVDGVVATMLMLSVVGAAASVLPSVVEGPVLVIPPALPVAVDGVGVKWSISITIEESSAFQVSSDQAITGL
ncbi:hypothetical protein B0H13DRAFT_2378845 [Mycena leptocephala]|nr:hypothetical protein B0H13DRAFT_2378845 [Mycena leptocephala]